MSTSHDWARELQKTAAFLLSRPEVEIGSKIPETRGWFFSEKEIFLNLVRVLKPGKKEMSNSYVDFHPSGAHIQLTINRDLVCRRLNPEYECEPLLSQEEDAEMESM
jgi:hypothetical protein